MQLLRGHVLLTNQFVDNQLADIGIATLKQKQSAPVSSTLIISLVCYINLATR